ncbi:MAG: extracellular solute-binding protein [Anaerolineales bacterium]|nr:extracellular solute-binding protein [Anaerolineales bacterium]
MKKSNPFYILLLLFVALALVLGACGGGTEAPEEPEVEEPEEPAGEPVEITAWTFTYQPFVDGLNAMADDFNAMQDEVKVNVEVFEWANYWDKIAVAVATDTGPDVFHSYTAFTPKYIAEGVLQPVPEGEFDWDAMAPMVGQFRVAGKLWAVPMGVRTFGYVYNPDIFEAGGQVPPTTWDEEIAVAEALTEFDNEGNMTVAGEGIYPKWEQYTLWQGRCHQAGGSYISNDLREMTWDDPACIEAFIFQTSKMTEYEIFVDGFYNDWATAQAEGVMAGFFAPSGVLGAFADMETPWAVAPLAYGSDNNDSIGNFWPMVITQQAKGEKFDAAVKFLQYVSSPEANRTWARITFDVPALLDVAAEDEFINSDYGGFVEALPNAVFIFDPAASEVRIGYDQAWDKVVLEGADPEAALLEGEPNAQQILDDFWAKLDALNLE